MMIPRFIGNINWAKQQHDTPDLWRLEEPYAQVTRDGHLIICLPWKRVNGASIPRPLWPIIGHPFEGGNKHWSTPHDLGYTGQAIVIDLTSTAAQALAPEAWVSLWSSIPHTLRIRPSRMGRAWFDRAMLEAMVLCGEPHIKRAAVFSAVRIFGGKNWDRS
jgi:hypothetical protein